MSPKMMRRVPSGIWRTVSSTIMTCKGAHDSAGIATTAAEHGPAADDGRSDRREQQAARDDHGRRLDQSYVDQATDAGDERRDHVQHHKDGPDPDACEARRVLVVADGIEDSPVSGVLQAQPDEQRQGHEDQERVGMPQDRPTPNQTMASGNSLPAPSVVR